MDSISNLNRKELSYTFSDYVKFERIEENKDNVFLKLHVKDYHLNTNKVLHGGVTATMLDIALGMAVASVTGLNCVTVNLNLNYLAAGSFHSDIYAKAHIVHGGYKLVTVEGEIYEEPQKIIAKGIGTFKLIH